MTSPDVQPPAFQQLDVGVVGAGRVGCVLGNALRAAGHRIIGVVARSEASHERAELLLPGVPQLDAHEVLTRSDLVLLAVGDDALAPLVAEFAGAGGWRSGQLVLHTAGRYGVDVLAPATHAGALGVAMHPAMTFSGTSLDLGRLPGVRWAITAPPLLVPLAQALVHELGGVPVEIAESARPLYHAALAHGANHLVTLIDQAGGLLRAAGVAEPGELLAPLVTAALTGALAAGTAALTGPAVRGDAGTISAHMAALRALPDGEQVQDTLGAYRELAADSARAARRANRIEPAQLAAILAALDPARPTDKEQE